MGGKVLSSGSLLAQRPRSTSTTRVHQLERLSNQARKWLLVLSLVLNQVVILEAIPPIRASPGWISLRGQEGQLLKAMVPTTSELVCLPSFLRSPRVQHWRNCKRRKRRKEGRKNKGSWRPSREGKSSSRARLRRQNVFERRE